MDFKYSQDKPMMLQALWEIMENCQDGYPYYWLGWDGFILFVYFPSEIPPNKACQPDH